MPLRQKCWKDAEQNLRSLATMFLFWFKLQEAQTSLENTEGVPQNIANDGTTYD